MSAGHIDLAALLAYRQGELDEAAEAALEEHYLGCADCATRLAEVDALASATSAAFAGGRLAAFFSVPFVESLRHRGVRLREYRVPRDAGVNCFAAPEDQMLVGYLEAPLSGVERVDAIIVFEGEHRLEDVPFDAATGTVVVSPSIRHLRALPAHRQVVRLVAVESSGERVLGEYAFNHGPYDPTSARETPPTPRD